MPESIDFTTIAVAAAEDHLADLHASLCQQLAAQINLVTPADFTQLTLQQWANTPQRQQEVAAHPKRGYSQVLHHNVRNRQLHRQYHRTGTLSYVHTFLTEPATGEKTALGYLWSQTFAGLRTALENAGWQLTTATEPGIRYTTPGSPYAPPSLTLHLQAKQLPAAAQEYQQQLALLTEASLQEIHQELPVMLARRLGAMQLTLAAAKPVTLVFSFPRTGGIGNDATDPEHLAGKRYQWGTYRQSALWDEFTTKRLPPGWEVVTAVIPADRPELALTLQRQATA